MRTLISVAICTRNRVGFLEKAVRSVLAQINDNTEILIVDNGSTDNTAALTAQMAAVDPRVKVIHEPQAGLSLARNLALRHAMGEWVIFMDDDAVAEPGWLAAYEKFLSKPPNEQVAVVGGAVIPRYEKPPPRWLPPVAEFDLGAKSFCLTHDNLSECNSAYRREAALRAGGFDARLGHCGDAAGAREGVDLNDRLLAADHEIWWLADAAVRHFVHARRMNLRWTLQAAFNHGRAAAIQRLKSRTGARRLAFVMARVLIAPFHCGVNLLVALASFPMQNGRRAVKALDRAFIIAGLTCGLLRQSFGRSSADRP